MLDTKQTLNALKLYPQETLILEEKWEKPLFYANCINAVNINNIDDQNINNVLKSMMFKGMINLWLTSVIYFVTSKLLLFDRYFLIIRWAYKLLFKLLEVELGVLYHSNANILQNWGILFVCPSDWIFHASLMKSYFLFLLQFYHSLENEVTISRSSIFYKNTEESGNNITAFLIPWTLYIHFSEKSKQWHVILHDLYAS